MNIKNDVQNELKNWGKLIAAEDIELDLSNLASKLPDLFCTFYEGEDKPLRFIAKTGDDAQTLATHLELVAIMATRNTARAFGLDLPEKNFYESLKEVTLPATSLAPFKKQALLAAYLGGLFHDLGKAMRTHQVYLRGEARTHQDLKNLNSHEIDGLACFDTLLSPTTPSGWDAAKDVLRAIRIAILWHHGRRGSDDIGSNKWTSFFDSSFKNQPYLFEYSPIDNKSNEKHWIVKQTDIHHERSYTEIKNPCLGDSVCFKRTALQCRDYFFSDENTGRSRYTDDVEKNALSDLCLRAVVSADWEASALGKEEAAAKRLKALKNNPRETTGDVPGNIRFVPANDDSLVNSDQLAKLKDSFNFDADRFNASFDWAKKVADKNVYVNRMVAGMGKTIWALQYLSSNPEDEPRRRLNWICPRLPICKGVYEELVDVACKNGSTVNIALVTGSERRIAVIFKGNEIAHDKIDFNKELSADITVTTIDNVAGNMIKHGKTNHALSVYEADLVFDEFHEVLSTPNIFFFLAQIIRVRKYSEAKTLLLSATPNPAILDLLGIATDRVMPLVDGEIAVFTDLNEKRFAPAAKAIKLIMKDDDTVQNPESMPHEDDWSGPKLFAHNAVASAQLTYQNLKINPDVAKKIYHGSYLRRGGQHSDWSKGFQSVLGTWGKEAEGRREKKNCLVSAQILRASLNVSFKFIDHYSMGPDNDLQLYGRLDRFCEYDDQAQAVNRFPSKGSDMSAVTMLYDYALAKRWHVHLTEKVKEKDRPTSSKDLYQAYDDFYGGERKASEKAIEGTATIKELNNLVSAFDYVNAKMLEAIYKISLHKWFAPWKGRQPAQIGWSKPHQDNDPNFSDLAQPTVGKNIYGKINYEEKKPLEVKGRPEGLRGETYYGLISRIGDADLTQGGKSSSSEAVLYEFSRHELPAATIKNNYAQRSPLDLARDPKNPVRISVAPEKTEFTLTPAELIKIIKAFEGELAVIKPEGLEKYLKKYLKKFNSSLAKFYRSVSFYHRPGGTEIGLGKISLNTAAKMLNSELWEADKKISPEEIENLRIGICEERNSDILEECKCKAKGPKCYLIQNIARERNDDKKRTDRG